MAPRYRKKSIIFSNLRSEFHKAKPRGPIKETEKNEEETARSLVKILSLLPIVSFTLSLLLRNPKLGPGIGQMGSNLAL